MSVITQVLPEKARVVCFQSKQAFFHIDSLATLRPDWQIQIIGYPDDGWYHPEMSSLLDQADRIVINVAGLTAQQIKQYTSSHQLKDLLWLHQNKVKIVLPIESYAALRVGGEIPHWMAARHWQMEQVLFWSGFLPDAGILFLLNVVSDNHLSHTILLWQQLESSMVFAPEMTNGYLTLPMFEQTLMEEILKPPSGSVLISSQAHPLPDLIKESTWMYQQMYKQALHVQKVEIADQEIIPFPCRTNQITSSFADQAQLLLNTLPSSATWNNWTLLFENALTIIAPTSNTDGLLNNHDKPAITEDYLRNHLSASGTHSEEKLQTEHLFRAQLNSGGKTQKHSGTKLSELDLEQQTVENEQNSETQTTIIAPEETVLAKDADFDQSTGDDDTATKLNLNSPVPLSTSSASSISEQLQQDESEQLNADVKKIFRSSIATTRNTTVQQKKKARKKVVFQSKKRKAVFLTGLLFMAIGMGVAVLLGAFQYTTHLAEEEFSRVLSDSTITPTKAQVSWGNLPKYVSVLAPQHALFDAVFSLPTVDTAKSILDGAVALKQLEETTVKANEQLVLLFSSLWLPSSGSLGEMAQKLAVAVTEHQLAYQQVVGQVAGVSDPPKQVGGAVDQSNQADGKDVGILPLFSSLFGETKPTTYALVLQNSQELRPTGGFIEAVAIISFAGGTLSGVDTYSSYQLDKKIGGQIAPPQDLQRVLGESNWWLRDANWSADGPAAAQEILRFIELATGKRPDGVMVLNTIALPPLLAATGPIELPEFDEILTDKNIAERLEYHTELPQQVLASTIEYRSSILGRLIQKLSTLSQEQIVAFITTLHEQLKNRHILLYSSDLTAQNYFSQSGWVGSLLFPTCPAPFSDHHCEIDGLAQVEANVGINRANAYISRKSSHSIRLEVNQAFHTHSTTWTNTAQSQAWPKGDYKVYVRSYIPRQVTEVRATLNGVPIDAAEVRRVSTQNTEEIGVVIIVPIQQSATLELTYHTPVQFKNDTSYLFYQVRQPGVTSNLASVQIEYPESWKVETVAPEPSAISPTLTFDSIVSPQLVQMVHFSQKK